MPAKGAIHCSPGALAAAATTKMQRSGAPCGGDRVDRPAHARGLLADGDVDADDVAVALVDDGVDRERGLAGGAVADDQLALAAAEGEQRVDDEQAGLHRLGHEIAVDDRRRRALDRQVLGGRDRTLAVERAAERVDDAPEQLGADRDAHHVAGAAHDLAGPDRLGRVEQHAADAVGLEHLGEAEAAALEAQQLVEAGARQAGDHRDAVADLLDPADLLRYRTGRCDVEAGAGLCEPVGGGVRVVTAELGRMRARSARQLLRTAKPGPVSSSPAISVGSVAKAMSGEAPSASAMRRRQVSASAGSSGGGG